MATMIGTQMAIFGIFIGYLLPSFFVDSYNGPEDLDSVTIPIYKKQMFNMLLAVACFATLITILVIFTFPERPGTPLFAKVNRSEAQGNRGSTFGDALIGDVGNPDLRQLGMME